jgi:protein arginine kinase activator
LHVKCDKCDNEATVHEVTVKGGKRSEKHMCEVCAREAGMSPQVVVHQPITQLLSQYITAQSEAPETAGATPVPAASATSCPTCELTFSQFRSTGLLGCATCYDAFKVQLTPMLARAHEGGTHHHGKRPRGPGAAAPARATVIAGPSDAEIAARIAMLRRNLSEAIAAEQYEKAAAIRDELGKLDTRPEVGVTSAVRAKRRTGDEGEQRGSKA